MNQDYKDLLSAFHAHGAKYLPMALNTSSSAATLSSCMRSPASRGTSIFFIRPDPANARATYAALAEFGAALQGIRPEDFTDRNSSFRFGRDPRGIDILPDIPGVDFDAAWEKRVEPVIDPTSGLKANFIAADDLIAAKLAAGRPQDIADVDAIRKAAADQGSRPAKRPRNRTALISEGQVPLIKQTVWKRG